MEAHRVLVCVLMGMALVLQQHSAAALQCMSASPCQLKCGGRCATSSRSSAGSGVRGAGRITYESGISAGQANAASTGMDDLIARVVQVAEDQTLALTQKLKPGVYPDYTDSSNGEYTTAKPGRWTSGFFSGVMWQLHTLTGKQQWSDLARQWQVDLANKQRGWISQLDLGFVYQPSFAHSYTVTKDPEDLRQALAAAEALSWAFNPGTGTVESWKGWQPAGATNMYKQLVIIDFIINVQMLLWAAKHVGPPNDITRLRMDTDPASTWRDMAISHARQVAANHVRPDGTTYHIVEYNPDTASINKRYTYQGYADNSTWARGQSWALLGFAHMYNETGLPEFMAAAQQVTDKWLSLLETQPGAPGDFVPLWDFSAPFSAPLDGPRDSSAGGIAALALLHLADSLGPDSNCGRRYLCAAVHTLRALASPKYLATPGAGFDGLFKHAVSNFPAGYGIDVGLIYGDYYGLSAFAKCASMEACRSYAW